MLRFQVWYGDGSTYTDRDGPAHLAPKTDVQLVVVEDREHGRYVCKSTDFYVWDDFDGEGSWQGCDHYGLWDYLSRPGTKVVLFGRSMGNRAFRELLGRALDDPYLPPKTANHAGERHV